LVKGGIANKPMFIIDYETASEKYLGTHNSELSYFDFGHKDIGGWNKNWEILGIQHTLSGDDEKNKQTYALINASSAYTDYDMGKLIIAAGPSDNECGFNTYYKYNLLPVSTAVTETIEFEEIYLKKVYSLENGVKNWTKVDAFEKTVVNGETSVAPITKYNFFYTYENSSSAVTGAKQGYVEELGETIWYVDRIYIRDITTSVISMTYSTPNPFSRNSESEVVLGAYGKNEEFDKYLVKDFEIREDIGVGGGGGGGTVTITPDYDDGSGTGTGSGGATIVYPSIGNTPTLLETDFNVKVWDDNFSTPNIFRPIMNLGAYEYANESVIIDSTDFNTKIYEDGTISTKTLMAEDGFFGGEIDSDGTFSGELKDATGTLKNVTITPDTVYGSFVVRDGKSLNATHNGQTYLKVDGNTVPSGAETETWVIDSFVWDKTNKSGTNAGKTFDLKKTLLKIPIKSGGTIEISEISGVVKRYAPARKTNKDSVVYVNCYLLKNNDTVEQIFNEAIKIPSHKGSGSKTTNFTTPSVNKKVSSDGYVIMELGGQIHLSTYSWLGADKAAGHVYYNTNTSNAKITYSSIPNGIHIGNDGIRVDGNVHLYSPNGKYGLSITNTGISLLHNSTLYTAGSVKSGSTTMIVFK
jgi:hypothetical protein